MSVLGMNHRNALILRHNPRKAIKGVNNKFATKQLLASAGVPVPRTLSLVKDRDNLASLDFDTLPEAWVVKPNRGRCGEGVVLIDGRDGSDWQQANGETISCEQLSSHMARILDGEMSLEGSSADSALIEPLIRTHADFARMVPYGLPDIRIICFRDIPLMAMTRLPTTESKGRANLHQGAVGAAIDFRTGKIFRAVIGSRAIEDHPSTGQRLIGQRIPFWDEVVRAATLCSDPLNLGYVGVDLVIDATDGVQVLECNAFPGLEIQNVNGAGLAGRLAMAQRAIKAREGRSRPFYSFLSKIAA